MRRPIRAALGVAVLAGAVAAAPLHAEMTPEERSAFRAEVRAYLLENPELLTEMLALLDERQQAATADTDRTRIEANAGALFDDGYSFVGGNPGGGLTMVEFVDYQCGYCRRAHPEVMTLVESDGDIRRIVKDFPILGPGSELAARAAIATLIAKGPDGYATVNERLMGLEGPVNDAVLDATLKAAGLDPAEIRAGMDAPEVTRRIEANLALGRELAIQGTPTFVFADQMLRGYVPLDAMRGIVSELRAAK
jgi:protein-disulfide isomerase